MGSSGINIVCYEGLLTCSAYAIICLCQSTIAHANDKIYSKFGGRCHYILKCLFYVIFNCQNTFFLFKKRHFILFLGHVQCEIALSCDVI